MKQFLIFLLFSMTAVYAKAQKIDSASLAKLNPAQREEANLYLTQAKKARTTGMVLSIGGGAIAVVGAGIFCVAFAEDATAVITDPLTPHNNNNSSQANLGGVLMGIGAVTALASIPFFLKVHKNHQAVRAMIYADKGISPTGVILPGTQSAGVGLAFTLGKKH